MQVCVPIKGDCSYCYTTGLHSGTTINVAAGLSPAASLFIFITDKFGNQYSDSITVNGNGSFDIVSADFPTGMFNTQAGSFDLFVTSDPYGTNVVQMKFLVSFWNCLIFNIICP
jgi:hypothetical protein